MLKPKLDPTSEEYVLEQLSTAEQKLVNLAEELTSRDLDTIHKEMEDEEFRHTVEGGVAGNIRVELPKSGSKPNLYGKLVYSKVSSVIPASKKCVRLPETIIVSVSYSYSCYPC